MFEIMNVCELEKCTILMMRYQKNLNLARWIQQLWLSLIIIDNHVSILLIIGP